MIFWMPQAGQDGWNAQTDTTAKSESRSELHVFLDLCLTFSDEWKEKKLNDEARKQIFFCLTVAIKRFINKPGR